MLIKLRIQLHVTTRVLFYLFFLSYMDDDWLMAKWMSNWIKSERCCKVFPYKSGWENLASYRKSTLRTTTHSYKPLHFNTHTHARARARAHTRARARACVCACVPFSSSQATFMLEYVLLRPQLFTYYGTGIYVQIINYIHAPIIEITDPKTTLYFNIFPYKKVLV